ncbi:hypothetical protein E2C01_056193 [Portunus trituberculatus]|uniref:Uncharacterized protein n=1 Tax=Portunus trituberculatus TaxID=210409 RepID=A0A5B7GPR1_PORTR|nr:hypothetical protein [Portunus trituberculatus]
MFVAFETCNGGSSDEYERSIDDHNQAARWNLESPGVSLSFQTRGTCRREGLYWALCDARIT